LILLAEPAPTGSVIRIRALGVIEAQEREDEGEWFRNDRLIAAAKHAATLTRLDQIEPRLIDEIEAFFRDYLAREGKTFQPLRRGGPEAAERLIEEGRRRRESSAWA
jgi:inorganic pyrophosphatase